MNVSMMFKQLSASSMAFLDILDIFLCQIILIERLRNLLIQPYLFQLQLNLRKKTGRS